MATAKKLPSGSWRCRVVASQENVLQPDGTYKKVYKYKSFTSSDPSKKGKAEAERMAAEWLLTHEEKNKVQYTLKEAMENVLEMKVNSISPSTYKGYVSLVKMCYPSIINKRIDRITNTDIQIAMNDLALTHSPKYVRNAYAFFTSTMKMYIPGSDFDITLPQRIKPDTYTPTDEEVAKVIDYFKKKDEEMLKAVYLSAFGTLRRSEIGALTAEDVQENGVYVNKSMVINNKREWVIKTTKTEGSTRFVQLPDFVIASFPASGQIVNLNPDVISKRFASALRVCEVQHFRFHDLRHYAATIMHTLGIPDQYIMQQGGWKSDGVLKRVYRGTMDDYRKQFTDKTNAHFTEVFGNL